jgi:uncharacterized membrane protein
MAPNPPEPQAATQPAAQKSAFVRAVDGAVLFVARHWLALFNAAWITYVVLPFLAPVLAQAGLHGPAHLIYSIYSVTCHQLPDHSYFLFGPSLAPQEPALLAAGMPDTANLFVERAFTGNEQVGHKVALCQRDVAIYAAVAAAGLIYAVVRRYRPVRPLSWKIFLLLLIPMAIDGGTQLVGLRESNWWLRTLTGVLFGASAVWLAYPYVEDAMADVIETETRRNNP